jgi:hypothetical protein
MSLIIANLGRCPDCRSGIDLSCDCNGMRGRALTIDERPLSIRERAALDRAIQELLHGDDQRFMEKAANELRAAFRLPEDR